MKDAHDAIKLIIMMKLGQGLSEAIMAFPLSSFEEGRKIMDDVLKNTKTQEVAATKEIISLLSKTVANFRQEADTIMAKYPEIFTGKYAEFLRKFDSDIVH
jgi:flagellar motor component MotA